ncbi:MAG: serine/threonine protein kinase, partial [Myxococcales bacterium]|nr:serine/threonine protein kinase [Myxococcales bacterium]
MTQRFGPYLLSERIGSGGMGEIFRARLVREQGFEKELVIKRILPHLSRNPEFVALFNNEAKIAARLDHPNICQIFDFGQHEGIYYIAMEYIRGHDLRSLLDRVERIPPAQAIQIACGCLRALDYAFTRRKVVHRDVSPQNIMLAYSGAVKLMDFGLAKAIHRESVASAGSIKGNFGYMSPEQVRSGDLDVRSDLFNLGAVLYEMLCGATLYDPKQPFARLIEQIAEARFEPLAARDPTIDPRIVAVVERALARDRGSRYANAAEMRASLDEVASACRLDVGSLPLASFLELTMGPAPLERRQTDTMPAVTEVAGGRDSVRALVGEPALASPRTDIAREPAARISPTLELRRPNGTADQPVAEGQTRVAVEPATATAATPHAAARPWIWGLSFVAIVAIAIAAALGWPGKPPQPLESFSSALSDGPMIHELQRRAGLPAVRPKLPIPSPPIPKRVLRYG